MDRIAEAFPYGRPTPFAIPKAPLRYALRLPHTCQDIFTHTHRRITLTRPKAGRRAGCAPHAARLKTAARQARRASACAILRKGCVRYLRFAGTGPRECGDSQGQLSSPAPVFLSEALPIDRSNAPRPALDAAEPCAVSPPPSESTREDVPDTFNSFGAKNSWLLQAARERCLRRTGHCPSEIGPLTTRRQT